MRASSRIRCARKPGVFRRRAGSGRSRWSAKTGRSGPLRDLKRASNRFEAHGPGRKRPPGGLAKGTSGKGPEEESQLAAAVDVCRGRHDRDAASPPRQTVAEAREDVPAPRGDLAQKAEVFRPKRQERNAPVGRWRENAVRARFEKIEGLGEDRRRRRDVPADDDEGAAVSGRIPSRVLESLAERAPALLDQEQARSGEQASPDRSIRGLRCQDDSGAGAASRRRPPRCEVRKEQLAGGPLEPLLPRF